MKYVLMIFIAGLFACGQNESKKADDQGGDTLILKPAEPADGSIKEDTLSPPDRSIYAKYVPAALTTWLTQYLADWNIPDPGNWEKYWWDQYKKDKNLVSYVTGDFNCDSIADHGLVLADKKGNIAAWAFLAKDRGFEKFKLDEFENLSAGHVGIGLEILPRGEHGDLNGDKPKKVTVKCEGVTVIYFEKAARSYYWEKGKLKWIQSGD